MPCIHIEPVHVLPAVFVSRRLGTTASTLTCSFVCLSKLFYITLFIYSIEPFLLFVDQVCVFY